MAGPAAARHGGGDGGVQWRPSLGSRCLDYGLQPQLQAQFVTPFHKSRAAKDNRNNADALATAARQGNMRFVPVKDVDQHARLSWHRVREGYKAECLAIGNHLRGLLAEFGVVVAKSDLALRRTLTELDQCAVLPGEFRELIRSLAAHWAQERKTGGARMKIELPVAPGASGYARAPPGARLARRVPCP